MITELFLAFLAGAIIGSKVREVWMHMTFREILKDLGVTESQMRELARRNQIELPDLEPQDRPNLPELEVKLEKIGDMIYAYSVKDDQFLGQGRDRDKLIESLTHNLTNVRVTIAKEHGAELLADKT